MRQGRGHLTSARLRAVERLRADVRTDALQAAFLHDKHDVYEGYIDLLIQEGVEANVGEIFELFERSRARAFISLLQAAHVADVLPDGLRGEVEALLAKVSACNEAIQAAVAADQPGETEKLLAEQARLAEQWADMQSRIGEAQRRRFGRRLPRLAAFQAALAEDQAYLAVLLGDEASYALLVDRSKARVFRLPPRRGLELLALPVLAYATWSNSETGAAFRAANVALTKALLGPIDEAVGLKDWLAGKHLLISPDGMLCYLPFDLLLADLAGVAALPDFADYPDFVPYYLLKLADISYVPSATAWLDLGRRKRRKSKAGLMAVYNVQYDTPEPPLWAVAQNILLKLSAVTSPPDMARLTQAVEAAWPGSEVVRLRSRADDGSPETQDCQSTESNFLKLTPRCQGTHPHVPRARHLQRSLSEPLGADLQPGVPSAGERSRRDPDGR